MLGIFQLMFGNNPIRKQVLRDDGALYISGIFATIQGEGPLTGTPAIFIRLSGCNLQCGFCDTDFEDTSKLNLFNVAVFDSWSNYNLGVFQPSKEMSIF